MGAGGGDAGAAARGRTLLLWRAAAEVRSRADVIGAPGACRITHVTARAPVRSVDAKARAPCPSTPRRRRQTTATSSTPFFGRRRRTARAAFASTGATARARRRQCARCSWARGTPPGRTRPEAVSSSRRSCSLPCVGSERWFRTALGDVGAAPPPERTVRAADAVRRVGTGRFLRAPFFVAHRNIPLAAPWPVPRRRRRSRRRRPGALWDGGGDAFGCADTASRLRHCVVGALLNAFVGRAALLLLVAPRCFKRDLVTRLLCAPPLASTVAARLPL